MTVAILKNTDVRLASHSTAKAGTSKGKILFSGKPALDIFLKVAKKLALVAKDEGAKEGKKLAVSFSAPSEKALRMAIRISKGKAEISIFKGHLAKSFATGLTPAEILSEEKKAEKVAEKAEKATEKAVEKKADTSKPAEKKVVKSAKK